jgi:RNA exonuclease 4
MAIDCEMVGVGAQGLQSTLGRVSIVNWHGAVLLDTFVRPKERVVDYRTWVSGVSAEDLADGEFSFSC